MPGLLQTNFEKCPLQGRRVLPPAPDFDDREGPQQRLTFQRSLQVLHKSRPCPQPQIGSHTPHEDTCHPLRCRLDTSSLMPEMQLYMPLKRKKTHGSFRRRSYLLSGFASKHNGTSLSTNTDFRDCPKLLTVEQAFSAEDSS